MSETTSLGLPYLAAAQAQKHVTHNEALTLLDGLVHLAAVSRVLTSPPVSPVEGDRYLVPTAPTGDWAGQVGKIALRMDGAWRFVMPKEGFRLWVSDEDVLLSFNGTSWLASGVPSALQNLALLGVNATADATNKLTVSAVATLFNHAGSGHQVKINKNAAADTASFLFQSGFSGRAEFGTTGDDNFHLKVSDDGAGFTEVLVADAATGRLDIHATARLVPQSGEPAGVLDGQLWFDSSLNALRLRANGTSQSLQVAGGSIGTDFGMIAASHLMFN